MLDVHALVCVYICSCVLHLYFVDLCVWPLARLTTPHLSVSQAFIQIYKHVCKQGNSNTHQGQKNKNACKSKNEQQDMLLLLLYITPVMYYFFKY